jgi:hypothetical protein
MQRRDALTVDDLNVRMPVYLRERGRRDGRGSPSQQTTDRSAGRFIRIACTRDPQADVRQVTTTIGAARPTGITRPCVLTLLIKGGEVLTPAPG